LNIEQRIQSTERRIQKKLRRRKNMDAIESQSGLSEDKVSQEEMGNARMAPVAESVRYHKRAQSAERRAEELESELAESRAEAERLSKELAATQKEQELIKKLADGGARDLEAAVLIAKARMGRDDKLDLSGVVEQLKKEKGYLFGQAAGTSGAAAPRTSPAKEQRSGAGSLERAARKAAVTGSRADLQEYMRKRRVLSV
jgi:predicted RNase H-like nuclease (RuvC/YqgF family)